MSTGLGRGLSTLIPKKVNKITTITGGEAVVDITSDDDKGRIIQLSPHEIETNPFQPRKRFSDTGIEELVDSIKIYGIIQPLIVTKRNGKYELIAGERRLRSAKIAKLDKVPVIVREADDQEKLELALIENVQRENLNSVETAIAYRKLIDEFNLTQEDVAKRVGKSRPSVTNTLRILNLPEEIQLAIIEGKITEGHAKYLTGLESEDKQMNLFRKIVHNQLTVSGTIEEARRMGGTKSARIKINYADKDKEFALREFFKAKVAIKRRGKGGQVVVEFYSNDELDDIVAKVKKQ